MEVSAIKARSAALEGGHWVGGLPGFPGVRLLVRSSASPTIRNAVAKALRDAAPEQKNADGTITEAAANDIDLNVFSSLGLLGWDGLTDGGEAIPFEAEAALDLMREAWQFRDAVSFAMRKVAIDYEAQTSAIEGN